jgi:hypothetical protein
MRKCFHCGTEIDKCMGFVMASDLLEYFKDKRKESDIREVCGLCVFIKEKDLNYK